MDETGSQKAKHLVSLGSSALGSAAGGVLGFLVGGPEGAIGGSVIGSISKELLKILGDVGVRALSPREEIRVGTAAYLAIEEIRKRLERGEKPRSDGFFQGGESSGRSNAKEIFEGVLLKSRGAYEERKIPHVASIFSNAAFSDDIGASEANYALQVIEGLTFRQMSFLAVFDVKARSAGPLLADRELDAENPEPLLQDLSALQEIFDLYQKGLVHLPFVTPHSPFNVQALLSFDEVIPERMRLTEWGARFHSLLGLAEFSDEDLQVATTTLSTRR